MLKPPLPRAPGAVRTAGSLPAQPFFALGPQRVRLARERYFDQGQRPTGLVAEQVIQSWARCLGAHQHPQEAVAFDPVSRSRVQAALARNRPLLLAAGEELQRLEAAVGGTGCRVLLTDAEGVVVHATGGGGRARELLPIVSRVGINLAEAAVGTNAPAVVLKTGQACAVSGAEHFYDSVQRLHCAAAPIRDALGGVAGVLDLTVEARPFGFDASALVGIVATAIENRLLQQGTQEQLVLQFQVAHSLLGSPLEALVGVTGSGRLAWANSTAQQLLGLSLQPHERPAAEALFGQRMNELLALVGHDGARACRLPNGLTVWMRAQGPRSRIPALPLRSSPAVPAGGAVAGQTHSAQAQTERRRPPGQTGTVSSAATALETADPGVDTAAVVCAGPPFDVGPEARDEAPPEARHPGPAETGAAPPASAAARSAALPSLPMPSAPPALQAETATTAPTLVDHQRELIAKVLDECAGNISQAARRLGVSRGLLYRRRREALANPDPCAAGAANDNAGAAAADPEDAP